MEPLTPLEKAMGVTFRDAGLLKQALVHDSFVAENPEPAQGSNERLEFLGDTVLSLLVAERLYMRFSTWSEGDLTRLRAELVRKETLYRFARELGIGKYIAMGQGEARTGGKAKPSNLASAMEAILGALYLDQGLDACRRLVLVFLDPLIESHSSSPPKNHKSALQELLYSLGKPNPVYRVTAVAGPSHTPRYTVDVLSDDLVLGTGSGTSKKAAEMAAARAALDSIGT